jgi:ATP-dependent helicase/nuclease subunit B
MFKGLYTIPRQTGFLKALARGLRNATAENPAILASTTILLPNRRSTRVLRDYFLDVVAGDDPQKNHACLLPRLLTFGDLADPDTVLGLLPFSTEQPPPPVSTTERLIHLSRFIQQRDENLNAVQALALARDLARLFDELALYETDTSAFDTLITDNDLSVHWQHTLHFTAVITRLWPEFLKNIGRSDPALYRAQLLGRLATAWTENPPATPIIMAGLTRAEPLLMNLAKAILASPQGSIILPGFDAGLPDDIWANLDSVHPDRLLRDDINQLGPTRDSVKPWPATNTLTARADWLQLAMLPARYTRNWQESASTLITPHSLQDVTAITAEDETHEANIIALLIRDSLNDSHKTVSLLTADRVLARRVAALLQRWHIMADDSSGLPFSVSPLCIFLQLVAALATPTATAIDMLAVLKQHHCQLKAPLETLEKRVLRGHYPAPGFFGLHAHLIQHGLDDLAEKLHSALDPLARLLSQQTAAPKDIIRAHLQAAEALSGAENLWHGAEGEVASPAFAQLITSLSDTYQINPRDYQPWLMHFLSNLSVRVPYGQHPRVTIHGLIEGRLQQADIMILAGLNEGIWPALPAANPWINRTMRTQLDLPAPEEVIAQEAHDFITALSAPVVYLTRAARRDGAPTIPARWWHRLSGVLTDKKLHAQWEQSGQHWAQWAKNMDAAPDNPPRLTAPAPCPPVTARPRDLSVTAIEQWLANPYGFYAKHILSLHKLDDVSAMPDAAERGQFLHAALAAFSKEIGPRLLLPDDYPRLMDCGEKALAAYAHLPGIRAFWWPWFCDVAAWWWQQENTQRPTRTPVKVEEKASHTWTNWSGGPFTLRARADRIDRDNTQQAMIVVDYKTGGLPSKTKVAAGLAPQLNLEALLIAHGGFSGLQQHDQIQAAYWQMGSMASRCKILSMPVDTATTEAGLRNLVEAFNNASTPYHATPVVAHAPRYDDYQHLARTQAWLDDEGEAA